MSVFLFIYTSGIECMFLPRDAMYKRGLCRHAVSVCVSVTFVHCVKTNKDIFNFFHRRVVTPL